MKKAHLFLFLPVTIFLNGCIGNNSQTDPYKTYHKEPVLKTRVLQTKTFYNTNKDELFNAMINLAQDESLTIHMDKEEGIFNTNRYVISVFQKDPETFDIRVSPTVPSDQINPRYYQYIFDKLQKSLFLEKELYSKSKETTKKEQEVKIDTLESNSKENNQVAEEELVEVFIYDDSILSLIDNSTTATEESIQEAQPIKKMETTISNTPVSLSDPEDSKVTNLKRKWKLQYQEVR